MKHTYHVIVDVGNSTTQYAIFEKNQFISRLVLDTFEEDKKILKNKFQKFFELFAEQNYEFEDAMIFSVVPFCNDSVEKIIKKFFKTHSSLFDWENYNYKDKDPRITDKIGADLIANLVAAETIYGHPAVIVDLGTVNKILFTDTVGTFVGASFVPGMEAQLKLMKEKTALLPGISKLENMNITCGLSTVESMQHGVFWSTIGYIQNAQAKHAQILNHPVITILTGGNAHLIKDEIENKTFDEMLTLKGMNILYLENK